MKVARTYRLDPELVLRVEEEAQRRGQSLTVFVTRALESWVGPTAQVALDQRRAMDEVRPGPAEGSALARQAEIEMRALEAEAKAESERIADAARRLTGAQVVKASSLVKPSSHLPTCRCPVCKPPK